jgi:hypothetical protein
MPTAAQIEELKQLIASANNVGDSAVAFSAERLRVCLQVGERLVEWKLQMPHGKWEEFAETHWPELNRATRARWQQLAIANASGRLKLNDARSLRHAYVLAGILPDTMANSNAKPGNKQSSYLVHIARLVAALQHIDIEKLSAVDRSTLAERLKPVVNLHNQLITDDSQAG